MDIEKFKKYYNVVLSQVYNEGNSPFHKSLTIKIVNELIMPLQLPKEAFILDVGCGPGYFLNEMKSAGYSNLIGITLSSEDKEICEASGHQIRAMDFSFLDVPDSSVDLIFARHSLEHSPFPFITLQEYWRALAPGALLYVEVPTPSDTRRHEFNPNHYSVLGKDMWLALFARAGFKVQTNSSITLELTNTNTQEKFPETYYLFLLQKNGNS